MSGLALVLAVLGAGWGFVADRIAARWPEHESDEDAAAAVGPAGPAAATVGPIEPTEPPAAAAEGAGPADAPPGAAASAGPAAATTGEILRPAGWVRPLDWRTPVVVVVGALALSAVGQGFDEPAERLVFGAWVVVLVLLLATDLDQRLLPDVLTLPLIPIAVVLVLAGLDPFVTPEALPLAAVVAVAVPVGVYALSIPFGAGAFGLGDVKFLIGFGLLAGTERFVLGLVTGILLGGVVILVLLVLRRITLRTFVPYGPFLILGALWAILGPG